MTSADPREAPAALAPGEVRSIQYLRGMAAFGVLLFHAAERAGGAFGVGAAGVDVFFVISGFIMWVVTCARPGSPRRFLVRRVQRIVPLYWAVTLLAAAVAVFVPGAFPNMVVTGEHLLKSLFFIPYTDPAGLVAPLIVPGWTLNYEMFFYLVFAAGLLAPAALRPWLVSAALAALVAVRPLGEAAHPLWATYTDPILLEFAAGVWLGKLWSERRLPGPRTGWAFAALGLLGFAVLTFARIEIGEARVVLWGVPAFLLVAGAVSVERSGPVPNWPPLRALGDASYSVYLIHGLAISATARTLGLLGLDAPAAVFLGSIVVGVAAGLVAYQVIEKPAMRVFRTGLGARRPGRAAIAPAP